MTPASLLPLPSRDVMLCYQSDGMKLKNKKDVVAMKLLFVLVDAIRGQLAIMLSRWMILILLLLLCCLIEI